MQAERKKIIAEASFKVNKFFIDNFQKEVYVPNNTGIKWVKPKRTLYTGSNPKLKRKATKHTLVDTGVLRKKLRGGIIKTDYEILKRIEGVDVPYAAFNNNGTSKIPARKFLYHSNKLNKELKRFIYRNLTKSFSK